MLDMLDMGVPLNWKEIYIPESWLERFSWRILALFWNMGEKYIFSAKSLSFWSLFASVVDVTLT